MIHASGVSYEGMWVNGRPEGMRPKTISLLLRQVFPLVFYCSSLPGKVGGQLYLGKFFKDKCLHVSRLKVSCTKQQ